MHKRFEDESRDDQSKGVLAHSTATLALERAREPIGAAILEVQRATRRLQECREEHERHLMLEKQLQSNCEAAQQLQDEAIYLLEKDVELQIKHANLELVKSEPVIAKLREAHMDAVAKADDAAWRGLEAEQVFQRVKRLHDDLQFQIEGEEQRLADCERRHAETKEELKFKLSKQVGCSPCVSWCVSVCVLVGVAEESGGDGPGFASGRSD